MAQRRMSLLFMLSLGILGITCSEANSEELSPASDHIVRYLRSSPELLGSMPTKRPSQSRDLYRLLRTLRSSGNQLVGLSKNKDLEPSGQHSQRGFFLRTLRESGENKGLFLRTLRGDDSDKGFFLRTLRGEGPEKGFFLRTLRSDPQKGFFLRTLKRSAFSSSNDHREEGPDEDDLLIPDEEDRFYLSTGGEIPFE
eukprot:TRINITY_DN21734_c0_g1_i1.p1 TRINITY_DN21734_c0_g1~~TRINITY_DN21734_c0_g1_i1.p1  ORF type:complete len:197 (-),score=55.59 TRINITY_DN21734_c0_g1_i1:174-764(-)